MKVFTIGLDAQKIHQGSENRKEEDTVSSTSEKSILPPPGYSTTSFPMQFPAGQQPPTIVVQRKSRGYKGILLIMLAVFLIAIFALTISEIAYNRQRDEDFMRLRWAELKHKFGYDRKHPSRNRWIWWGDGSQSYNHALTNPIMPTNLQAQIESSSANEKGENGKKGDEKLFNRDFSFKFPTINSDSVLSPKVVSNVEITTSSESAPLQSVPADASGAARSTEGSDQSRQAQMKSQSIFSPFFSQQNSALPIKGMNDLNALASASRTRNSDDSNEGILRDVRLTFLRNILQKIRKQAEQMGFDGTMQISVIEMEPPKSSQQTPDQDETNEFNKDDNRIPMSSRLQIFPPSELGQNSEFPRSPLFWNNRDFQSSVNQQNPIANIDRGMMPEIRNGPTFEMGPFIGNNEQRTIPAHLFQPPAVSPFSFFPHQPSPFQMPIQQQQQSAFLEANPSNNFINKNSENIRGGSPASSSAVSDNPWQQSFEIKQQIPQQQSFMLRPLTVDQRAGAFIRPTMESEQRFDQNMDETNQSGRRFGDILRDIISSRVQQLQMNRPTLIVEDHQQKKVEIDQQKEKQPDQKEIATSNFQALPKIFQNDFFPPPQIINGNNEETQDWQQKPRDSPPPMIKPALSASNGQQQIQQKQQNQNERQQSKTRNDEWFLEKSIPADGETNFDGSNKKIDPELKAAKNQNKESDKTSFQMQMDADDGLKKERPNDAEQSSKNSPTIFFQVDDPSAGVGGEPEQPDARSFVI